jgi:NTP pyrophosphatase (non-canonical NTP hydrolase)
MMNAGKLTDALDCIYQERHRQEQLKAVGKFKYTCSDSEMETADRLAALMEEVGEVATALLEMRGEATARDPEKKADLKKELIQVAAVATAWVEYLMEV